MDHDMIGPFVILFPVDPKEQTFFESFKNKPKVKPHWCYLLYDKTQQQWEMRISRIRLSTLSSTQMLTPPHEEYKNLIIYRGASVPQKLQVMLMSGLYFVESLERSVLALGENGELHAYQRSYSKEHIQHRWSYCLHQKTNHISYLSPFHEKFGIEDKDFSSMDNFFLENKKMCELENKFTTYRNNVVTDLDRKMLDSLNLCYSHEVKIETKSINIYRENFNELTADNKNRLSRLYFSNKTSYFQMMITSRLNRDKIDNLVKECFEFQKNYDELIDIKKQLWMYVARSPVDFVYIADQFVRYTSSTDTWIDFLAEIDDLRQIRFLCCYAQEEERLHQLYKFLLPMSEKYPDKFQSCLNEITDFEWIDIAQAHWDVYQKPLTGVRPCHIQDPTVYLTEFLHHMSQERRVQIVETVKQLSCKSAKRASLYKLLEQIIEKLPHDDAHTCAPR